MVGVHGTASAIFTTVRDAAANVIMISQASSEHSVCFAVKRAEAGRAVAALNHRSAPTPCIVLMSLVPCLLLPSRPCNTHYLLF